MNEADQNRGASRREFMRDGFRYAVLTGLAAVSATLFRRSGGKLSGQTCINQGLCPGCTAFTDCGLPQALSAKEFQARGNRQEAARTYGAEHGLHAASTSNHEPALKRTEARALEAS